MGGEEGEEISARKKTSLKQEEETELMACIWRLIFPTRMEDWWQRTFKEKQNGSSAAETQHRGDDDRRPSIHPSTHHFLNEHAREQTKHSTWKWHWKKYVIKRRKWYYPCSSGTELHLCLSRPVRFSYTWQRGEDPPLSWWKRAKWPRYSAGTHLLRGTKETPDCLNHRFLNSAL